MEGNGWPHLKSYTGIHQEGLRNTTKTLIGTVVIRPKFKPGTTEYESDVLAHVQFVSAVRKHSNAVSICQEQRPRI
jgi:hypothetical protein